MSDLEDKPANDEQGENQIDEQSSDSVDESEDQPNTEVEELTKQIELLKRDLAGKDKALTKLQREKMDEQTRAIEEAKDSVRQEFEEKLQQKEDAIKITRMIAKAELGDLENLINATTPDQAEQQIKSLKTYLAKQKANEAARGVTPGSDDTDLSNLSPQERMERNHQEYKKKYGR